MGLNTSSASLWNREMQNLISTVKITEKYDFDGDFVIPFYNQKQIFFGFMMKNGTFNVIQSTLSQDDIVKKKVTDFEVKDVVQFKTDSVIVLTENNIIILCFRNNEIIIRNVIEERAKKIIKVNNNSFIAINESNEVLLITNLDENKNENTVKLWHANEDINDGIIFQNGFGAKKLIIATCKSIAILEIKKDTDTKIKEVNINTTKVVQYDNNNLMFSSKESNSRYLFDVSLEGPLNKVETKIDNIKDIISLEEGTVLFYNENTICTFTLQLSPQYLSCKIESEIIKLFTMKDKRINIVICKDGTVTIIRHPIFKSHDKKAVIESYKLFKYHNSSIKLACAASDYSFITFDEDHICIFWESFPEWYNAPEQFGMFKDI